MLTKPTVATTNEILAQDLLDLLNYYNEIWTGSSYTFDANHITGTDDRRFGWGQTLSAISPTPSGPPNATIVTISDINQAIAQINAGLYHTEDDPTHSATVVGLYSHAWPILTDPIPVTLYNDITNKAETLINDKYKVDWSNFSLAELQTTRTTPWELDLQVAHKFAFSGSGSGATAISGYNEARHFFNSGGELTLEFSMAPGGTVGNQVWQQIFDQFDSIRIGAESCRVVSDEIYDVISTSGVNKGFYTGIESSGAYSTILDAGVFRFNDTSEYADAFVYVHSEYNSRRIRIELAADEDTPGGIFNVYVKVTLIEDADDTFQITQPITLASGYVQPSTTPLTTDGNKSFMTEGSTLHQFEEREIPTITLDTVNYPTGWIDQEYYTVDQLDKGTTTADWAGTWLKDVKAGAFITGKAYTIKSINDDIPVTLLITGHDYKIKTVGTTDFTALGAANNTIGTTFTATDVGIGTGTAGGATSTDTDFTLIGFSNNINSGSFVIGTKYKIVTLGSDTLTTVTAGSFVIGTEYTILVPGSTDFTLIGATDNNIGTVFTATGVGVDDGTATYVSTSVQEHWNTTAGTTGVTYAVGTIFTASGVGTGTGTATTMGAVGEIFTATGPGTGSGSADEVQDATDDPGNVWSSTPDDTDSDSLFQNP